MDCLYTLLEKKKGYSLRRGGKIKESSIYKESQRTEVVWREMETRVVTVFMVLCQELKRFSQCTDYGLRSIERQRPQVLWKLEVGR